MSFNIVYKGFIKSTPQDHALDILTQVFKGNRNKAEDVYFSAEYVLQSFNSEDEARLMLPRYTKSGLRCEIVDATPAGFSGSKSMEYVSALMECPECGVEQAPSQWCIECGHTFKPQKSVDLKGSDSFAEAATSSRNGGSSEQPGLSKKVSFFIPAFGSVVALLFAAFIMAFGSGKLDKQIHAVVGDTFDEYQNPVATAMQNVKKQNEKIKEKQKQLDALDSSATNTGAADATGTASTSGSIDTARSGEVADLEHRPVSVSLDENKESFTQKMAEQSRALEEAQGNNPEENTDNNTVEQVE